MKTAFLCWNWAITGKSCSGTKAIAGMQQTNTRLKDLVMDKQETKIFIVTKKQSPPYLLIRVILLFRKESF